MTTSTARSDAFLSSHRERARLATLHSQYALDSPAGTSFETLALMARLVTGAPIALVSFVDAEVQHFKAASGIDVESTPRDISFCTHAIENDDVFEVCDALSDPRFKMNPLVLEGPGIRYYLGIPIRGFNQLPIGTLCVIDDKPRLPLRDTELEGLIQLAKCVESLMEQGRQLRIREAQLNDLEADLDSDPNSWEETLQQQVDSLRPRAAQAGVELDLDCKPVDCCPPSSARRIFSELVSAAVDASPAGATVGVRLKADPYFVVVSIYREHGGLQIVKPGDTRSKPTDLHQAQARATEAMVAVGGYLEVKPWTGGTVTKLWFPLNSTM